VDQIARGKRDVPFAYVIPQAQRDPVAAVELLRRLAFGGVRVARLASAATIDGAEYPAGTWVIPTDQEYAALAREVLDVQTYPDTRQYRGGPPERPYDAAGWSLPLQMGVRVTAASTALGPDLRAKLEPMGPAVDPRARPTPYNASVAPDTSPFDSVPGAGFDTHPAAAAIVPPPGRLTGAGASLAVDPAQNNAFRAINRAWAQGATVSFTAGAAPGSARYIISGLAESVQADLVRTLALVAERTDAVGAPVKKPRIGLFRPWGGSMSEGWTRWLLEQYGFEYVTLRPADFRAPLADKVDVVVLSEDARVPLAGARGRRPVRPEHADTLSDDDLQAFERFVRAGGSLVCVNSATAFPIQRFRLPVRNAVAGVRAEEFSAPGSIVEVIVEPAHQVMAGLEEHSLVFVDDSPAFDVLEGFRGTVLARYAESGSPLRSGFLLGEKYVHGKAAALDVQLDAGHVVLIGFRPEWRGQPFGTFKVLFNALLFSGR
jgi:hypothetical protein